MSLAYKVTISITSKGTYEDHTQQRFMLPEFCPENQIKEITEKILEERDWKRDSEQPEVWVKEMNSNDLQKINLEELTLTTFIKMQTNVVKESEIWEKDEKRAMENLQNEVDTCVREQAKEYIEQSQGSQELNEILLEVAKNAIQAKAKTLGEILEITENKSEQCYELNIKLKI
ncbi:MAG: hypothetical protein AABZ60_05585 [Planctomycetota bacterium]